MQGIFIAMKTCLYKILASFKKNGRHQVFENHKDALYLILQLAAIYMARKATLIVIHCLVAKPNGRHITCLVSNGVKTALYLIYHCS